MGNASAGALCGLCGPEDDGHAPAALARPGLARVVFLPLCRAPVSAAVSAAGGDPGARRITVSRAPARKTLQHLAGDLFHVESDLRPAAGRISERAAAAIPLLPAAPAR